MVESLPWDALHATLAFLSLRDVHHQRRVSVALCEAWLRHVNQSQRPKVMTYKLNWEIDYFEPHCRELWLSFSFPVLRELVHKGYFSSSPSPSAAAAASPMLSSWLGTFPQLKSLSVYQAVVKDALIGEIEEDVGISRLWRTCPP